MNDGLPILMLDNNAVEADILQQALSEVSMSCSVVHCTDSQKAIDYLIEGYGERPWLILMNCYAAGMPGLDFLKWLKSHEEFQVIPTIALADDQKEHLVDAYFALGAVGYIVKPGDFDSLKHDLAVVLQYWAMSRLPSGMSYASHYQSGG